MENHEKAFGLACGLVATGLMVGSAVNYINVARVERAKRRKIAAWEKHNLELIAQSRERLMSLVEDPTVPWSTFINAMLEEQAWLDIVIDPGDMYA